MSRPHTMGRMGSWAKLMSEPHNAMEYVGELSKAISAQVPSRGQVTVRHTGIQIMDNYHKAAKAPSRNFRGPGSVCKPIFYHPACFKMRSRSLRRQCAQKPFQSAWVPIMGCVAEIFWSYRLGTAWRLFYSLCTVRMLVSLLKSIFLHPFPTCVELPVWIGCRVARTKASGVCSQIGTHLAGKPFSKYQAREWFSQTSPSIWLEFKCSELGFARNALWIEAKTF